MSASRGSIFVSGGIFHYCMQTPDGKAVMWDKFTYRQNHRPGENQFLSIS